MLERPMSPVWYLRRGTYLLFMLREVTSLFNGLYAVFLLVLLHRLFQGPEAYGAFLRFLGAPWMVPLHVLALGFSVLHTVTWFNATGKAIAVWRGERRLPDAFLAAPSYLAWVVVSVFVFWFVLRG